jgi:SiaC family regulatory phosphoprotein
MRVVNIDRTDTTPQVVIDYPSNTISIKGICTPENPKDFFEPIYHAVKEYKQINTDLLFDIQLQYFNTGSSKCLVTLLMEGAKYEGKLKSTKVNWFFEKDDAELLEVGQEFSQITKLDFNYLEISE